MGFEVYLQVYVSIGMVFLNFCASGLHLIHSHRNSGYVSFGPRHSRDLESGGLSSPAIHTTYISNSRSKPSYLQQWPLSLSEFPTLSGLSSVQGSPSSQNAASDVLTTFPQKTSRSSSTYCLAFVLTSRLLRNFGRINTNGFLD
jgi:hypothetical protein